MRVRRQMPSLVSMWMLDVFCCALGCVTLLWLLNTREARLQAVSLAETRSELQARNSEALQLRSDYEDTQQRAVALQAERDRLADQLALLRRERDDTARKLARAREESADLTGALSATEARAADREDRLARKQTEIDELARRAETLQSLIREKEKAEAVMSAESDSLSERLSELRSRYDAAMAELARLPKLEETVRELTGDLADARRELDRANASIIDLQGDRQKLADKVDLLKTDQDNRFAGVAMTGKKVIFLVDMSGSMNQKDPTTPDPEKWPLVVETLAKVMRSVPSIDQFQVILFSETATHLLGGEGEWLDFEGESTVAEVKEKMLRVRPSGDTNMYLGMQEAFAYRARGLDTIYLLSDGLPTVGPGVSATSTMTELERSNTLATHVRGLLRDRWNPAQAGGPRVKINSIGFFYESPEVGAFLWALSRENDGSFVGMSRP